MKLKPLSIKELCALGVLLAALLSVLAWPAGAQEAPAPVISISAPAFVAESNLSANDPAAARVVFTLTLSVSSGVPITVHCATADFPYNPGYHAGTYVGDAHAGEDYVATTQTITFAPGQITKTFSVPIMGDYVQESNLDGFPYEIFSASLSNPVNSSISEDAGSATAGIIDDDDGIWHFEEGPAAPPTDVQAVPGAGLGEITLTWTPDAHAAGYVVMCSTTAGGPYALPYGSLMLSRPKCSFVNDYGLALGTTYYYVVVAVDGEGTLSDYSNEVSAVPYEPAEPYVDASISNQSDGGSVGLGIQDGGVGQSVSQDVAAGGTATYYLRVRNSSDFDAQFTIKSAGGGMGWGVKYLDASYGDVTSLVTSTEGWHSSTTSVGTTPQDDFYDMTVEVTDVGAAPGSQMALSITATSSVGVLQSDTVRAISARALSLPESSYRPDAIIRSTNSDELLGDGVYNSDAAQTISAATVPGHLLAFIVTMKNDGQADDLLKLSGPTRSGSWSLKYLDTAQNNTVISSAVTSGGWSVPEALAPGASREIRVEATPDADAPAGAAPAIAITVASGSCARLDVVQIAPRLQKLAGIEYSVDAEQTWLPVPEGNGSISVGQNEVLSLRALKADPDADWPQVAGHYVVQWTGSHIHNYGEVTSLMFETPTQNGAVETVTADGGNTLSIRVQVLATQGE